MPTRFYISSLQSPPVSPAYGGWDAFELRRRVLSSAKIAGDTLTGGAGVASVPVGTGDVQAISAPLAAQTISGTVKAYIRMRDVDAAGDCLSRLLIRVLSGDGATVRGTLLALGGYGVALSFYSTGASQNRAFADGDGLSSLAISDGDRLVVEFGHFGSSGSITVFLGADSAVADLPEDETTTTALLPWIEFSGAIALQPSSGGSTNLLLLGVG